MLYEIQCLNHFGLGVFTVFITTVLNMVAAATKLLPASGRIRAQVEARRALFVLIARVEKSGLGRGRARQNKVCMKVSFLELQTWYR